MQKAWLAVAMAAVLGIGSAWGQIVVPFGGVVTGGVQIDASGVVAVRETTKEDWAKVRARLAKADKAEQLSYVSLPKVFAVAREAYEAKKPVPEAARYLGGLTQVRYVFVYPEAKDLVIAGPAEAWDASNPVAPVGKVSGRPVMQLEDLITVMRTQSRGASSLFGCSLDPSVDDPQKIVNETIRKYENKPRAELMAAMAKALGPQLVKVFGVPVDSRVSAAMVAADYRLKRASLGLDALPAAGVGIAFDAKAGGSRLWFEPKYEPVLVSEDGNSYALRGPRLCVKVGAQVFKAGQAVAATERFGKAMNEKMAQIAPVVPAFADLSAIADLGVVAALIKADQLDQKVQWDTAWAMKDDTCPLAHYATPRTAETQVAISGLGIASGGVALSFHDVVASSAREADKAGTLGALRQRPETGWQINAEPRKEAGK